MAIFGIFIIYKEAYLIWTNSSLINHFNIGIRLTYGNHFCDGDHSLMRIQNGLPKLLQLNVHTFGALYEYNNDTGNFDFVSGESLDVAGVDFPVNYPDTVNTINGHPEIFVSNGSHGNWGSAGKHNYLTYVDSRFKFMTDRL